MMGQLIYLKDVVTLKLDQKACMGCGMCLLVCPHSVLSLTNGKIEIANRDACMECGACARNCPVEALSVRSGVGCAAAVINSKLRRKSSSACCTLDSEEGPNDLSACCQGVNVKDISNGR
jgi:NAD-dependent dihydropyrimidine dehydrogenase PreA subunit